MTRTSRFTSLLSILAAGLIFSSTLAVEPGDTVDLRATAAVAPCLTEVNIDAEPPAGAEADATCSDVENAMQAKSFLAELVDTAFEVSASAAVLYEFQVDGDEDTNGNLVDAMLGYAISWNGVTKITGAGDYDVAIKLAVEDVTDAGNPMVVAVIDVHDMSGDSGVDQGSDQAIVPVQLVRGNSYLVTASLATSAATEATAEVASAVADYLSDVGSEMSAGGARVDALVLQVGVDLEDLAAQVAANTEAIAMNTEAIEANTTAIVDLAEVVGLLADEVEAIQEALEDLGDVVANHTHYYLTGKGTGHNNTMAETGPASGEDDPEIQPVKTNRGRSKKFSR